MRNGKCTDGLRRIAMLAAVALMMTLAIGCGDDECDDGEQLTDGECLQICTDDDDCGDNEYCASAEPEDVCLPDDSGDPECTGDEDCEDGEICDDGQCVDDGEEAECTEDGDCEDGEICDDGQCVDDGGEPECTVDADCAQGYECVNEQCVEEDPPGEECTADGDCASGLMCHNGNCVECAEDGDCPEGEVCDQNVCRDPNAPSDMELCDMYCDLQLGCINQNCDMGGVQFDTGVCISGDPQDPTDSGCMGDLDTDREGIEAFVFGDVDAEEGEDPDIDYDNPNTCEDVKYLRCGLYGGWGGRCDCDNPPDNVGGACTEDAECDSGDLLFGECIDLTGGDNQQCIQGICYIHDMNQEGDIVDDGGCGAGNGCLAAPVFEGGELGGICVETCDSSEDCGADMGCQPSGGYNYYEDFYDIIIDEQTPEAQDLGRYCQPACETDDDCGDPAQSDFHCNDSTGVCEMPCGDDDQLDDFCDELGGTCRDVNGGEYCELD